MNASLGPSHGKLYTYATMAKLWARLNGVPNPDKAKLLDELQKIASDIVEGNLITLRQMNCQRV